MHISNCHNLLFAVKEKRKLCDHNEGISIENHLKSKHVIKVSKKGQQEYSNIPVPVQQKTNIVSAGDVASLNKMIESEDEASNKNTSPKRQSLKTPTPKRCPTPKK
jgi:hypothetical protein